jgi:hypothetical protein
VLGKAWYWTDAWNGGAVDTFSTPPIGTIAGGGGGGIGL